MERVESPQVWEVVFNPENRADVLSLAMFFFFQRCAVVFSQLEIQQKVDVLQVSNSCTAWV